MKKLLRIATIIILMLAIIVMPSEPSWILQGSAQTGQTAIQAASTNATAQATVIQASNADSSVASVYIDYILATMTTEEKVGQLILARRPSEDATVKQNKYQYGGFILFGRDFKNNTPERLTKAIARYQDTSKINMLIAVDEEGGSVVRASQYPLFRENPFESPRSIYKKKGYKGIISNTAKKDEFLKSLGINTNLAPVADVTYSKDDYMYSRAISNNPDKVADLIAYQVAQMNEDNVVSALKHFPGYGNTADTHTGVARDKRDIETFEERDLKPFQSGIDAGADMIMVSHTIVNAFDKKKPASISAKVYSYIRDSLGFDGVVITDGLAMEGIKEFVDGDEGDAAVLAVIAGADMVCADNNAVIVYKKLNAAVKNGEISEERLNESVRRILQMKINRNIISTEDLATDANDDANANTTTDSNVDTDTTTESDYKTEDKILLHIVSEL